MTQIGVVGGETFTLGFRLTGIKKVWNAATDEELERAVLEARRDPEISILVMETQDLSRLDRRIRYEITSAVKPTLVAVGADEDDSLRNKIKQAVGVDLW